MAAKEINLIPKDTFEQSPAGKFVNWAINIGRWIVVFTDLVVILAFLSRFYFDTKLADLYEEVKQKEVIIEATSSFEKSFRFIQERLELVKTLSSSKLKGAEKTNFITYYLPAGVVLSNLSITPSEINLSGIALTHDDISKFLRNLLTDSRVSKINISSLVFGDKQAGGAISFTLSLLLKSL